MYIQGKIITENILTTVLPEKAIVKEGEKSFVFIKIDEIDEEHAHDEEKEEDHWEFKMMEVIIGGSSDSFVEVKLLDTIPSTAKFAANGAYYLIAEMGKEETEHNH